MLTLSYAEALANPTYCDAGVTHGKKLARTMGVKPNEPRPLKDILPYCTIAEFLWCLRAVRKSQKQEAATFAYAFIDSVRERVLKHAGNRMVTFPEQDILSVIHMTYDKKETDPSQAAINISNYAIKYFGEEGKAEEKLQRAKLEELING